MHKENRQWEGNANQRKINPADPAPRHEVAEHRTKDWPENTPQSHRNRKQADIERALLQRRYVRDDDFVQHVEPAAAKTLQHSAQDNYPHGLCDSEDYGTDTKEGECDIQRQLAANDIGGAGVDRLHDGDGKQEGDICPKGLEGCAMELFADYLPQSLAGVCV